MIAAAKLVAGAALALGFVVPACDVIVFALERLLHFTSMCLRPVASMPVAALPAPFAVSPEIYFDN